MIAHRHFPGSLSDEDFHNIHSALNKVRAGAKTVKIDRQALTELLMDYSTLIGENEEMRRAILRTTSIEGAREALKLEDEPLTGEDLI